LKIVFRQNQLFTFLLYCNGQGLEKKILDCGAGGNCPPLAIFAEHGYKTFGIDNNEKQIELSKEFERNHGLDLGIEYGDMKHLPYEDNSISYVYSYNSIFHMSKKEISETLREIHRVLPQGGLAFVNFASEHDKRSTSGEKAGEGEYIQLEFGEYVLHSFFKENEAEQYFEGFKVLYKENRIREGYNPKGDRVKMGFIDYIIEKV
jgi:ubiquinone/menaquinone biosynthesis C-methylase UbiE